MCGVGLRFGQPKTRNPRMAETLGLSGYKLLISQKGPAVRIHPKALMVQEMDTRGREVRQDILRYHSHLMGIGGPLIPGWGTGAWDVGLQCSVLLKVAL